MEWYAASAVFILTITLLMGQSHKAKEKMRDVFRNTEASPDVTYVHRIIADECLQEYRNEIYFGP